jgi:hypothetical protein
LLQELLAQQDQADLEDPEDKEVKIKKGYF